MNVDRGNPLRMVRHWGALPDAELRQALERAHAAVAAFAAATEAHGSLIQSWIRGRPVVALEHYPAGDLVDAESGSQFYYHCHREAAGEHGHLHLFFHATRNGRRRRFREGHRRWVTTAPTHLFGISLDARGLPVGLFTVNRWVTEGHWFDADQTLALVDRFVMQAGEAHRHACTWITEFVRMYRPLIADLLKQRDCRLARQPSLSAALADHRLEVLSDIAIDWGADLAALETAFGRRARPATACNRPIPAT